MQGQILPGTSEVAFISPHLLSFGSWNIEIMGLHIKGHVKGPTVQAITAPEHRTAKCQDPTGQDRTACLGTSL